MKKNYLPLIYVVLLVFLAVVGCSNNTSNQAAEANDTHQLNEQQRQTTEPVYGGTLRVITGAGPTAIGHPSDGGIMAYASRYPAMESLLAVTDDRDHEGVLAKAWEEDVENLTLTFWLQEGVKFHDGSEMTADVVKWNYEFLMEKGALRYADFIDSIEVIDTYTLVFHLNDWHNQIVPEWGVRQIFSREAMEKHGEAWTHDHVVGTGPFYLENYTRDVGTTWIKFDQYWQEGYPYLDRIEIYYIPEQSTAAAMMEAGEADIWLGADGLNTKRLMEKGFVYQTGWAGAQTHLIPNTADPNSPFLDKRVREAVEYAIDKQAIVDALGYGFSETIDTIAPRGEWGGDRQFRHYDPEKAKQLLIEAGYPEGLEISLIAQAGAGGRNEMAEALANYLEKVGFKVNIDIADAGRYYAEVWDGSWKDLALAIGGTDTTFLTAVQRWWGHNGVYQGGFKRPEKLIELSQASLKAVTREEQKRMTEEMVYLIAEEALVIPISHAPTGFIHTGKVHTDYMAQGNSRWKHHDMWLEP